MKYNHIMHLKYIYPMVFLLNVNAPMPKAARLIKNECERLNVEEFTQEKRIELAEAYLDGSLSFTKYIHSNYERTFGLLENELPIEKLEGLLTHISLIKTLIQNKETDVVFNSCYLSIASHAENITRKNNSSNDIISIASLLSFEKIKYPNLKDQVEIITAVANDTKQFRLETRKIMEKMRKLGINISLESLELINLGKNLPNKAENFDSQVCRFLLVTKKYEDLKNILILKFQETYPNQELDALLRAKLYTDHENQQKNVDLMISELQHKTLEEINEILKITQKRLGEYQSLKLVLEMYLSTDKELNSLQIPNYKKIKELIEKEEEIKLFEEQIEKLKAMLIACERVIKEKLTGEKKVALAAATPAASATTQELPAELCTVKPSPADVTRELEIQKLIADYERRKLIQSKKATLPTATAACAAVPATAARTKELPPDQPTAAVAVAAPRMPELIKILKDMKENNATYHNHRVMSAIESFGTIERTGGSRCTITVHHANTGKPVIGFMHERHGAGKEDFAAATSGTSLLVDLLERAGYWPWLHD